MTTVSTAIALYKEGRIYLTQLNAILNPQSIIAVEIDGELQLF